MSKTTFDTLSAAKSLQAVGIDAAQAEAIALVIKDGHGEWATKSGIQLLGTEIRSEIKRLGDKINNLRWTVIIAVGIAVALIKILPPV